MRLVVAAVDPDHHAGQSYLVPGHEPCLGRAGPRFAASVHPAAAFMSHAFH